MSYGYDVEKAKAHEGDTFVEFYRQGLDRSKKFRQDYVSRLRVVKAADMPFERSPDGLIKHVIHENMNTAECCLDIYMQFLDPGKASGIHRHLSEEVIFVVEGRGHDLHWDVSFECDEEITFDWTEEPQKFEWARGDFVYIPPYCAHQHVNSDPDNEARIIVINNKIIQDIGFDWFEQLENAEGF